MSRIGVFVCHCGENIARRVDIERVAGFARQLPGVAVAADYAYMCSAPGQKLLRETIASQRLTGVVVAACSPQLHEPTFRGAASEAGLNPFLCEMANIREQCAWVHEDGVAATEKACALVASAVEKTKHDGPLQPVEVPVTKRALVIGAGVAGIRAALDIAEAGYEVTVVERNPSIGGNMSRLSETFPTLDCSQCILTPLMVQVSRHPRIELLTYAEVEEVGGYVGNFRVRIRKKARFVREDLCTGCDDCVAACPVAVPNEFDMSLAWRRAIYLPFPQAVPPVYTLDADACLNARLTSGNGEYRVLACERCAQACAPRAIDYDMRDQVVERQVGAIVVATGYELIGAEHAAEYGYRRHPDVLDGLEFERLLSASGPTMGELRRPSDGRVPKSIVFIQCVGSRDPRFGVPYCSRICCMYTAKHALLYRHKVPDGRATVFYIDIRAAGKGYEEFVARVMEEEHVVYVRGRVSRVVRDGDRLRVHGVDTLSGQALQVEADMVVLATAVVPQQRQGELARKLRLPTDSGGFLQEAHPKLRPVETLAAGVFLAGAAQGPKDIPDTVAQASAAGGKAVDLLSQPRFLREPTVARVDQLSCTGCFDCERVCAYGAIERRELHTPGDGRLRFVAEVNEALCEGCGVCAAACRARALDVLGFADAQLFAQLGAVVGAAR
ncbi:MAG TPA: CoB--CoM heterodisulfide reductase iron-sulfur subunit A family protein [Candidatus Binatia bacterium]|nr:CoB--CoM heterodisulfide reductase iron-sulfur subunit A family protein [Candidatus Binatia bacterium]